MNEDSKRDFYIKGVIEDSVSSISEILDKLKKGESNRHYAQTMMNHTSSRSHTIFQTYGPNYDKHLHKGLPSR